MMVSSQLPPAAAPIRNDELSHSSGDADSGGFSDHLATDETASPDPKDVASAIVTVFPPTTIDILQGAARLRQNYGDLVAGGGDTSLTVVSPRDDATAPAVIKDVLPSRAQTPLPFPTALVLPAPMGTFQSVGNGGDLAVAALPETQSVQILSLQTSTFHKPADLRTTSGVRSPGAGRSGGETPIAGELSSDAVAMFQTIQEQRFALTPNRPAADTSSPSNALQPALSPRSPAGDAGAADAGLDMAAVDFQSADVAQQLTAAFPSLVEVPVSATEARPGLAPRPQPTYPQLRVLDLVLQPQELGRVTIKMKMAAGSLSVAVAAEKDATRQLLERERDVVAEHLTQLGYDLDSLSIQQMTPQGAVSKDGVAILKSTEVPRNDQAGAASNFGQHDGRDRPDKHLREGSGLDADESPRSARADDESVARVGIYI